MTTKVRVDAHAGWPVEVRLVDVERNDDGEIVAERYTDETVKAGEVADFFIHSERYVIVTEGDN